MRKKWLFMFLLFLLVACNQTDEKKDRSEKLTKEAGRMMEENVEVIVSLVGKKEATLKGEEAKIAANIISKAEKQNVIGELGEPEYVITVKKNGQEEKYKAWLRTEARTGWLQKETDPKSFYLLSKVNTEKLLSLFPAVPLTQNGGEQQSAITQITKKDLQITRFHIKTKENTVNYTVYYTISDALYKKLEKEKNYYFQLQIPVKVQKVINKENSEQVQGELVKEGYKQYEVNFVVPVSSISSSQLKMLEAYYDQYNLKVFNNKKEEIGAFQNIIEIVKEYGEKMQLER
ncbi:hypothetical protein SAMN04488168_102187 [Bacillus sp. 491mf]|uniref:hypothetical protein n=1 Tax=unclassified Bacillus (in: firmicutes) TaxID=185979 RepID=UPI00054F13D7|nr:MULTISPECIES: hypothetical protein [unclassified Bacillus (in: firmicutes)]SFC14821.1 hypothetical protein SAMN04488168_102187 [Bacillus sp. 491mf]